MLIISQNKKIITEKMELSIVRLMTPKYKIIVWLDARNYKALGEYETEERAKEVLQEIIKLYSKTIESKVAVYIPPKVYSMPEN